MSFNPQYRASPTTLGEGQRTTGTVDDTGALRVSVAGGSTGSSSQQVQGNIAHDAVDAGNPVKVGGVANSSPIGVASGDRADLWMTQHGAPVIGAVGLPGNDAVSIVVGLPRTTVNTGAPLGVVNHVFNGSSWDRARGINATTGLGIAASGEPLWTTNDLSELRINTNASGDTALVAAVSGQTTRVHAIRLSVAGAVIVQIKNGSTVLEVFNFAGNGGSVLLNFRGRPYYKTSANTALNINLSGTVQVDGRLEYITSA